MQQGLLIEKLKKEGEISSSLGENSVGRSVFFPMTCQELGASDPALNSGIHWIDPTARASETISLHVYCNMATGKITFSEENISICCLFIIVIMS